MTYTPTTWIDEVPGETPVKFVITDDVEGEIAGSATIELATAPLTGTPYNAANLNHLEQGLVDVEAATVPAILTAKGDLAVASAVGAAAVLNAGDAGDYLIPDSAETPGLKWSPLITHGLWTSENWDDPRWPEAGWSSAHQADTTYLVTASSEFGVPVGTKMVLINLSCRFLGRYVGQSQIYLCSPANVSPERAFINMTNYWENMLTVGSLYAAGWVPLDENGQFAVRLVHEDIAITLTVLAYML